VLYCIESLRTQTNIPPLGVKYNVTIFWALGILKRVLKNTNSYKLNRSLLSFRFHNFDNKFKKKDYCRLENINMLSKKNQSNTHGSQWTN